MWNVAFVIKRINAKSAVIGVTYGEEINIMNQHAVILLHQGPKVLFVQRSSNKKSPNTWSFASGTIEPGEIPETTVAREAKEELGLDVEIEKLLTTINLPHINVDLHFVLCSNTSNQPIVFDPREIQQYRFMTFEDFFKTFADDQLDRGPRYLRNHPEIWNRIN